MIPYFLAFALAAAPGKTEPTPVLTELKATRLYQEITSNALGNLFAQESALEDFTLQGQTVYLAAKMNGGSAADAAQAIALGLYQCRNDREKLQQCRTAVTATLTTLERKLEQAAPALASDEKYQGRKKVVWDWMRQQGTRLGQYCRRESITDFLKERGLDHD